MGPLKYPKIAAHIRAQIAEGILLPGEPVPSGAELARTTGCCAATCRRARRALVEDGVLAAGASPAARPRVPARDPVPGDQDLADAARTLAASLAARRRAAGLTQLVSRERGILTCGYGWRTVVHAIDREGGGSAAGS